MGRLGLLHRRAELDGRVDDVRDADRATESVARLGQLISEHAHVDVVDRGSGVPPEILPRIFDRFVTDGHASGMGLGLYLASRIAAAHGATLAVSSPPGNGATFRLSLPASGPPARGDDL
ncbi:sensor histidine kinase [Sorangium sp. So ce117]|uniref:sensor histidine kinase n=1 Tax=Sorangium sp. So ce117 TaxID=3133277 RepID=UPI003F61CC1B